MLRPRPTNSLWPKSSQCEKHVQTDPPAERKEIAIQSSESSLKIEDGLLDQCQPPKMVASQSKVFCSPCRIFVPVHDLEAHFRVSLNHPSCDSCSMGFENGLSFTKHAFTFHTELCCETCGLAFSGSHLLDQHYADSGIHVTCPVCTHGFKDEILLQEHLQAGCHEDVDLVEPDTFASGLDQITEMKRNDDDEDTPDSIVSSSRSRRSSISSASFITSIERPASALSVATMSVADSSSANSILSVAAAGRQCAGPLERGDSHSRVDMRSISTIPPSPTPTGHEEPIQANRIPSSTSQSIAPSSVTAPQNLLTKSKNSFDCRVCGHCPEEPVATMCGHLFCLRCLVQGLASTGRCPACDNVILLRLQV
ncbi:hypothetical protein QCA50_013294 [Cerrena zonata]|uniref:RING-type domain-containing protein n=1 Tax=Cerrena zonata TaxID=2478898 RepID=A0AAW0G1E8_9APHY